MTRELGFLCAALLLVASGVLTHLNVRSLADNERAIGHTHEVLDGVEGALSALKDAETGYRGYHITGDPTYLQPYRSAQVAVPARLERLRTLTAGNVSQTARLAAFEERTNAVLAYVAHGIEVLDVEGREASLGLIRTNEGKVVMDATRVEAAAMQAAERELLEVRSIESRESYLVAVLTTVVSTALGLGLVVFGYAVVARDRRTRDLAAAEIRKVNAGLEDRVRERTVELEREQEFQRALLEHVTDGIVACDSNGRLTLFNRATREFHGLPAADLPPDRWADHYSLFLGDGVTPMAVTDVPLVRALRGEAVRDVEMVIAPRNGPRRVLLASGQAFFRDGGEPLGAVVSMHDVTDQRRADAERRRFVRRLEESNRELEQFATIASHDLQEPLRKIQAFSDRLREECAPALDERGTDYLTRIVGATSRMRTLIDDLLAFSRVGRRGQNFVPVDLAAIAREVVYDLEPRLQDVNGKVELGPLPAVVADPTQMRQLLQNLIGNALKFRSPERPSVVRVESRPAPDDTTEIRIADNGIGFESQYADRIFQMFQRLHGRGSYDGNGIGLAICRRIVERHHGTIRGIGSPGEGATFVVLLPLHAVRED